MHYAITAYAATAVIWVGYFIWLKRRIARAKGE